MYPQNATITMHENPPDRGFHEDSNNQSDSDSGNESDSVDSGVSDNSDSDEDTDSVNDEINYRQEDDDLENEHWQFDVDTAPVLSDIEAAEATSQPTTGGRMTDLTIATMTAAETAAMEDAAEDVVMMGVAVITAEGEETDTPRIGPSLFPETRGWKRSSSTKATAHPGSTLKGKLKLLESLSHLSLSH